MVVRVIYLVITELTIATSFAQVFVMRHQISCCRFLCLSRGLKCGLLKNPQQLCYFILIALVLYQSSSNYNNSDTRVAGRLRVPTVHSRDILLQAKGGSSWLSPLRSFGSRDEQAGEAGLVEP
jgi:hypothetical protein